MRGVPSPWEALILAAAGWRVWHLLAIDAILDPLRDRVFYPAPSGPSGGRTLLVEEAADAERWPRILKFVECPYCFGFWVTAALWLAWTIEPWALIAAAPFALHTGMLTVERIVSGE